MGEGKKGLIMKTWERCKSLGGGNSHSKKSRIRMTKSKSWPRPDRITQLDEDNPPTKHRVAPHGCFSVYVGTQKQRFVIKTEYANHPLFKMLLEEAELEYGYNSEGPLVLPCDVDVFCRVLVEMEERDHQLDRAGCATFSRTHSSYQLLTHSRVAAMNKY